MLGDPSQRVYDYNIYDSTLTLRRKGISVILQLGAFVANRRSQAVRTVISNLISIPRKALGSNESAAGTSLLGLRYIKYIVCLLIVGQQYLSNFGIISYPRRASLVLSKVIFRFQASMSYKLFFLFQILEIEKRIYINIITRGYASLRYTSLCDVIIIYNPA